MDSVIIIVISFFYTIYFIGAIANSQEQIKWGYNSTTRNVQIGDECSISACHNLFDKVGDIFTETDCAMYTTFCCTKNDTFGCCAIKEYFDRDGSRFILPLSLSAVSIVLIVIFSYCLAVYDAQSNN